MKMIETAKVISIFRLLMMNHPQATAVMKNVQALVDDDTVDAEPVVYCKDCKHSGMYCFGTESTPRLACLEVEEDGFICFASATEPMWFCSYGERKADDAVD